MQLLVVRHGIAEERDVFAATGEPDARRPLTEKGARRMRGVAAGLATLVGDLDLLASSPLTRARQTADLLGVAFHGKPVTVTDLLGDASEPARFVTWLARQSKLAVVAVVGHEPMLTSTIGYLLTGEGRPVCELKKGGACLLDLGDEVKPGRASLCWLLTPAVLRQLGR